VLDEQQLGDYIDRHFTSTLFRLETLDRYEVGSDGDDFARYLTDGPGPDMTRKGSWLDHIRGEVARGLHTYRVHVVRGPLTGYLRFEFEWGYAYNAAVGEAAVPFADYWDAHPQYWRDRRRRSAEF
jgi:hypothetical protein